MAALNTDLYELTMAAGYVAAGKTEDIATFELSIRRLPSQRNFLVSAGLQQAVEYLLNLRFEKAEIDYLRSLDQFRQATPEFFDTLANLRFTGDLFAMREGTPFFACEPIAIVRAPILQAQLVETYLLSTFAFQTSVASKAARCVHAAQGKRVVEFGSRRAHSPAAAILAGRAAYVGGCAGTSNAETGMRFGIPVFGTAAHSWTMAFESEQESFRELQKLLGESTVFLIDTYDSLDGARLAAELGQPSWGVRLDSGDLDTISRQVRELLDSSGLPSAKIMATNDLDEYRIAELTGAGAPIDAWGVGTQLSTSADAPSLAAVYKLVELASDGKTRYTAKFSHDKATLPGAKQVYRMPQEDWVALAEECPSTQHGEPLLRPIIIGGELVEPLPSMQDVRNYATKSIGVLPPSLHSLEPIPARRVLTSARLQDLADSLRRERLSEVLEPAEGRVL